MKTIKILLTPLEPYFLGNDRTFHYGENDKKRIGGSKYFIHSEAMPLQTSVFGVLRYLGIQNRSTSYSLDNDTKDNIGAESFQYENGGQKFGRIIGISPIYLQSPEEEIYMRAPRDHNTAEIETYSPFTNYQEVSTSEGDGLIPIDYEAKQGICDGFISVSGRYEKTVIKSRDIFESVIRTGIDIKKKESAYYKMSYVRMKRGWSFAFWAEVEDGFTMTDDRIVFMGARKSAFSVAVTDASKGSDNGKPKVRLPGYQVQAKDGTQTSCEDNDIGKIYLISDTYINKDVIDNLRKLCLHSNIDIRTARGYTTIYGRSTQKGRFQKTDKLYRLIKAGSVFIYEKGNEDSIKAIIENEHMQTIGCNNYIVGGEKE